MIYKLRILFLVFTCILRTITIAQTANWGAYKPNQFPTNVSGQIHGLSRISQLKFHPSNSNKMYAVSARGGLFISNDAGANWQVTTGTDFMASSRLASVCIDHSNDQIIYLGTGDHNYYYTGNGIYKTINGGTTFAQIGLSGRLVFEIIMDPLDANVLVAGTDAGIYKSINGGTTWALKTANRQFDDIKQKTPNSRVLYAGTTDSAFFRSLDFGNTWSQINAGIVMPSGVTNGNGTRIAVSPADTNIVYFGMVANGGMLYKSTNGGNSFSAIKTASSPYLTYYTNSSTSSSQGDYNFGIGVDRTNANIIYLVAHNVWKSTDGGANWSQLTNWWATVHTDMHQINTSPYDNSKLYNSNDGGVWLSTDGGTNWTPKSDGIYGYEIYHGNCSPTSKDMISIGTQDNGELYGNASGWFTNRGGDWTSQCAFDYRANSSMVYYYKSNKRRLVTGGEATFGLPANVTSYEEISFNRSNSNLAFVADTFVYRTTNLLASTPTWTSILNTGKKIMAMHSSLADANYLYVVTNDAMLYVSTDALSATPTFNTYNLPNTTNNRANIFSIANNANVLYATFNTKVYSSANNGATWTNVTYNLPAVNHVKIISDEYFPVNELVFIASNNKVYYKTSAATTWTLFDLNLPSRTSIMDMSIYNDGTSNSLLRVSTYGRGVWETPIATLRTLTANFIANNTKICPGNTVSFSDLSSGNVLNRNWSFPGGTPSTSTLSNPTVQYLGTGIYNVSLTVSNASTSSTSTQNNYISTTGTNLPLTENFEGSSYPPQYWQEVDAANDGVKWQSSSAASGFGVGSKCIYFDNWNNNTAQKKDEIWTMPLDGSLYNSMNLSFDVAYWTYNNPAYQDTFEVLVSTNCGASFTSIYKKGGATLSTVSGLSSSAFTPTSSQWRSESVNLNSFIGQTFILAFRNIGRYGNNLFLDNIAISAKVLADAGTDKTICNGNSISIGSNNIGLNYSWSPSTGLSSATESNPLANPNSTTEYIVTATHPISLINAKDTVIVNVNPMLDASISLSVNNTSQCQGTSVLFNSSILNGGTSPIYSWKLNGNSVGTNSPSYSNNTLQNNDVVSCILTSNASCLNNANVTSNYITMNVLNNGNWLGNSSDWSSSANWCGGVPDFNTNVIISSGVSFLPKLTSTSFCKNLNLGNNSYLELNDNSLSISGVVSGNGKFKGSEQSTLNFISSGNAGDVRFLGSNFNEKSLGSLILNKNTNSTLNILDTVNIINSIELTNGIINTNDKIKLVSNSNGTARIKEVGTGGSISGKITAERYVPAGNTGWSLLGSPVTDATISDWTSPWPVSGFPTSGFTGSTGSAGGFVSIYSYDESIAGAYDIGYLPATNVTNNLTNGKGFWAYLGTGAVNSNAIKFKVFGTPQIGTKNLNISFTSTLGGINADGWNLVSNPYPCEIDWLSNAWTKNKIDDAIYIYNADYGSVASYVAGVGTNGGSRYIASHQGFVVKANGIGASLIANEGIKVSTNPGFLRSMNSSSDVGLLNINLTKLGSTLKDEIVVRFNSNASPEYDRDLEAIKIYSGLLNSFNIMSIANGTEYAINALPSLDSLTVIPIKVKVNSTGNYFINFTQLEDLISNYATLFSNNNLVLEDLQNSNVYTLNASTNVPITVGNNDSIFNFLIRFSNQNLATKIEALSQFNKIEITQYGGEYYVESNFAESRDVTINIANSLGEIVYFKNFSGMKNSKRKLPNTNFANGLYIISAKSMNYSVSKKLIIY